MVETVQMGPFENYSYSIFLWSHAFLVDLDGWSPANPVSVALIWAMAAVDVVVLAKRSQALLVRGEVQVSVQDASRVRGLEVPASDQSPVEEVLGRHKTVA